MEPVTPDIGRPYYRALSDLDALAIVETHPDSPDPEPSSTALQWWRRRESPAPGCTALGRWPRARPSSIHRRDTLSGADGRSAAGSTMSPNVGPGGGHDVDHSRSPRLGQARASTGAPTAASGALGSPRRERRTGTGRRTGAGARLTSSPSTTSPGSITTSVPGPRPRPSSAPRSGTPRSVSTTPSAGGGRPPAGVERRSKGTRGCLPT